MSLAIVSSLPLADPTPPTISFDGVNTLIQSFATSFGPAVLVVLGLGLTITAVIWGLPKLLGLFKKTAK